MKNFFIVFISLLVLFLSVSCDAKISLTLQKDGSVDILFNGGAGAAFSKMVLATTGGEESFNIKEIADELSKSGFSNVKGEAKGISEIKISMKDKGQSSYIFNSGVVCVDNNQLRVEFTQNNLKSFYDSADEQVQMILDLFLAPVFNDEKMTESEYIEMLGTVYGAPAAKEVQESRIYFTIKNSEGEKINLTYRLSELLCSH